MSVSAGTGGTTLVGVVTGGGAIANADGSPAGVLTALPFTGASHVMVILALGLFLIVAGLLAIGLVRRRSDIAAT
jgi:LPXTG-motif cell wall-anchored protein